VHKHGTPAETTPWMARDALACCALNPVTGRTLIDDFGPADLAVVRWSLSGLV